MIELDGIEYAINSPDENAASLVDEINNYCVDNNIKNSKDEVIEIAANWANPLYMIVRGFSVLLSKLQTLVYSAGCALSIPSSSARQLLNIADIAGIKRRKASKTTITAVVYSDADASCHVTTSLSMTITVGNTTVIFHPAFDITVPANASRPIVLIAETYGPYSIAANENASFDANPPGLRYISCSAASPGQDIESIASLRMRIQRRTEKGTMLDKVIDAIKGLEGVSLCNIYYNRSVTSAVEMQGITVPPRQALLFIQGWSADITKTFYSYMLCQCAGSDAPLAVRQDYTLPTGQVLSTYILPPTNIAAHIKVYVDQVVDDVTKQAMRDSIASLATKRTIGQSLTSAEILTVLTKDFPSSPFTGCTVSKDGTNYSYQILLESSQLVVFDNDNINIIAREN